jgi:predicted ATPase/transcriptional regulator with XRE-family HTH domain
MAEQSAAEPSFGDLLQQYRRAAGLTQEALAERTGLSARGISDLERGAHAAPRRETLGLLLGALELDPCERTALSAAARKSAVTRPQRDMAAGLTAEASLEFPAARIPAPLDALIGREDDIAAVSALMHKPAIRLLTLTGPGGIGKTRLAIAAATALDDDFPGGVAFISLGAVTDPALVMARIALGLGVREGAADTLVDQLATATHGRRVLVVLDNFEQVLNAAAGIRELLERAPGLSMLVTSRAPLRVSGEHRYVLGPLATTDPADGVDDEALGQSPAVMLFVQRARAVDPHIVLDRENVGTIAAICRRLDGLPLAIELAAARTTALPLNLLHSRLTRALPLLASGARDAPDRQRTLRDTIAWSYDLLSPRERRLFRRLSVFVGGWTLAAAEAVIGGDLDLAEGDVLDALAVLVEQSLIHLERHPGTAPRYGMLDTVREFAVDAAADVENLATLRNRHAAWFRTLVLDAEPDLWGPAQRDTIRRLGAEIGNLRAALDWLLRQDEVQPAARMMLVLGRFWYAEARTQEAMTWLAQAAARRDDFRMPERAQLMASHAYGLYMQGNPDALSLAQDAVAMLRDFRSAPEFDPVMLGVALLVCGHCIANGADQKPYYKEAVALLRAAGDQGWLPSAVANLGGAYFETGDWDRAVACFAEAIALYRNRGTATGLAFAQTFFANILRKHGDEASAIGYYRSAMPVLAATGNNWVVAVGLEGLGAIAAASQPDRAAWLFGAAARLRASSGAATEPEWWGITPELTAELRIRLGDGVYDATFAAGAQAPLDGVMASALASEATLE